MTTTEIGFTQACVNNGLPLDSTLLLKRKRDGRALCCIYFLMQHGYVVYVGQTVHLERRLSIHTDKPHDAVFYIPCEREFLTACEQRWIGQLTPEYNGDSGLRKRAASRPSHVRYPRTIAISDDEWRLCVQQANLAGKSVSEWIRGVTAATASQQRPYSAQKPAKQSAMPPSC